MDKRGFISWAQGAAVVTVASMLIMQGVNAVSASHRAHSAKQGETAAQTTTWTVQPEQTSGVATQAYAEQGEPRSVAAEYLDAEGTVQVAPDATVIDSGTRALENGWYVCEDDLKLPEGLRVYGEVDLIVGDAKLFLGKAIEIPAGSTLRIYCAPGCEERATIGAVFTDRVFNNGGTLELCGGSIGNGAATAVYNHGTFVMYGGAITGCYNNAVCNLQSGSFRLLGGSISDNKRAGVSGTGMLSVAGSPVVENNAGGNVVLGRSVVVDDENPIEGTETIHVEGPLGRGARIGVTTDDYRSPLTSGFSAQNPDGEVEARFFSDYRGLVVAADKNGEGVLVEAAARK